MKVRVAIEIDSTPRAALLVADKMRAEAENSGAVITAIDIVMPAGAPCNCAGNSQLLEQVLAELKGHTKLFGTALDIEPGSARPVGFSIDSPWPPLEGTTDAS